VWFGTNVCGEPCCTRNVPPNFEKLKGYQIFAELIPVPVLKLFKRIVVLLRIQKPLAAFSTESVKMSLNDFIVCLYAYFLRFRLWRNLSHIHRRESLKSSVRRRRRAPSCLCSSVFCIFRNVRGTARGFNSL
jgi:hypothetical protein